MIHFKHMKIFMVRLKLRLQKKFLLNQPFITSSRVVVKCLMIMTGQRRMYMLLKTWLMMMGSIKEFDQKVNTEGCFFEDFGCISSIRNYLRKVKVMLENRNADKWTKACETIIKAPKRSTNFL